MPQLLVSLDLAPCSARSHISSVTHVLSGPFFIMSSTFPLGIKKKFISCADEFFSLISNADEFGGINVSPQHITSIIECFFHIIDYSVKKKNIHNVEIRQKESSLSFEFHIGSLFNQPI